MAVFKRKIVIFGYYGAGNLGDDIILYAIIKRLSKFTDKSRIVVVSSQLKADTPFISSRYGVEAITLRNPIKFLKTLISGKVLLMGGGGIIQPGATIFSIFLYTLLFKLFRCKIALLSVGVEFPHNFSKFDKFLTKLLTAISDVISVRDIISKAFFKTIGALKHIFIVRDLSFLLYNDLNKLSLKFEDTLERDPYVIFVLKDFLIHNKLTNMDLNHFINTISEFCNYLINSEGLHIYFLVAQHGFKSDINITRKIMHNIHKKDMTKIIVYGSTPLENILKLIKNSLYVVSMRLHPSIIAFMMEKPVIGLAYSNKIKTFMEENGLRYFYIDISQKFTLSTLKRLSTQILNTSIKIPNINDIHNEVVCEISNIGSLIGEDI
ncbi:MAG: polysaccharide pyruvyl transferase family protein [Candidatus Methanomethylicia archaeon]